MRKFSMVVLMSLGLIVAFSMNAAAADVKFSGQYYVVGMYEDNRSLAGSDTAYSRAFIWTNTRVQTIFNIVEGLSLTPRFDAFDKSWGAVNRSSSTTEDKTNSGKINSTEVRLQENLEMEYGYVTFKTAIGQFDIGYQFSAEEWGTVFGNVPGSRPRARFTSVIGPVYVEAEVIYSFGKARKYESPATAKDVDKEGLGGYALAKVNLGPMYVGGQFGYSSGDDGSDATKDKTGPASSTSWTPALIFGNANLRTWASYSDYDNLTYLVGAGYLWTGNFFKATKDSNQIGNDYLVMNQLTLNF